VQRFRFILEYDGSRFFGWQRQKSVVTVQQVLEDQLSFFCKHKVTIYGAGRTDTGVHATGQVAHADLDYPRGPFSLQSALNHFLVPKGLSVIDCALVEPDFHARYSAIYRAYQYRILNRCSPAVYDTKVWHIRRPLDVSVMHAAAQQLVGVYDFSSFRDSNCQSKSPIKQISKFDIIRRDECILADLQAPSFLHHQVRIMIGTIKSVGAGVISLDDFIRIRDLKDRAKAGITAPPQGLALTRVFYPN
jgi:tRNA pseudouridine38-40 synthase